MNYYDEICNWEKELMNPYSEKYDCRECPLKKDNKQCNLRQYGECPASILWNQGFNINRHHNAEVDEYYTSELEAEQRIYCDTIEELEYDIEELKLDLENENKDFNNLQKTYNDLQENYNQLQEKYNQLLEEVRTKGNGFW